MSAPVLRPEISSRTLAEFAFGNRRFRSAAELPEPAGDLETWWRAVALGGAGYYAAARTMLDRMQAHTTDPVLLSLAASTAGSLRRQLGRHARAAHDDGRAAALVLPHLSRVTGAADRPDGAARTRPGGEATETPAEVFAAPTAAPDLLDAVADALIGLAADALGTGRLALATTLLDRCAALLTAEPTVGCAATVAPDRAGAPVVARTRAYVRLHWVRAETALAAGRGADALAAAETALSVAESGSSVRHHVKSRLLVAAAASVTGDADRAVALVGHVDEQCHEYGLLPLRWACAMLRTGLPGPAAAHRRAAADAEACRALISRRGGRFRDSER